LLIVGIGLMLWAGGKVVFHWSTSAILQTVPEDAIFGGISWWFNRDALVSWQPCFE